MSAVNLKTLDVSLLVLEDNELNLIGGGGFEAIWYDAVFCASAGIHGLWEWGQMAGAYQSSLAPCDKK